MVSSKRVFRSVVCAMGMLLVYGLIAVAQPPDRQPTRRVDNQQPAAAAAAAPAGRQPLRAIQRRTEARTPVIDLQTGTFELRREVFAPPPQRSLRRVASHWRLGLWTDNAPKGLRVREVSRYSPAWRYGIEEGDYVLDIMGYPVGFYEGAYYPLAETLNQATPRDGWVNVLIWNKRNSTEEATWIQAEPRTGFGRDESSE